MSKLFLAWAFAGSVGCASTALARVSQESPIDFAAQIQPIFDRSCATSFCHAGTNPAQGLSLEAGKSYDGLVGMPSSEAATAMLVKPSDTENSYLYRKLRGEQASLGGGGARMPFGQPALAEDQLRLIEAWISQGALKEPPPPVTTAVGASAWGQAKRVAGEWAK